MDAGVSHEQRRAARREKARKNAGALNALKDYAFTKLSESGPVQFVQVGAHDGVTGDPVHRFIRKYRWTGMLIEPVPYLYRQLRKNYLGFDGLRFLNACVSEVAGRVTLYTMREMKSPPTPYYDQLSSLSRDVILKYASRLPDVADYIEELQVDSLPLSAIIHQYSLCPDVLVIDTEGYDFKVLTTFDFQGRRPQAIYFEWKHLDDADKISATVLLKTLGYELFADGGNALGIGERVPSRAERHLIDVAGELVRL